MVRVVGGKYLGLGRDVGVGELGPTRHVCHNDTARRHLVELPNPRDTFHKGEGGNS